MKKTVLDFLIIAAFLISAVFMSCDNFHNEDVMILKLGSLQKILDGYVIRTIDFDSKGNAWIGTSKQDVICYNAGKTVIYHAGNSIIPEDFVTYDIAIDKNDNVWIGGSGGLLKFDGKEFILYDTQNTPMPVDYVKAIEVDSKNNVWFASCNISQGGIVKYNGHEWTVFTPDNSVLPFYLIENMTIDQMDNVWLAGYSCLVKISDDKMRVYDEKDLGFSPYKISDIQFDSKNHIWGVIDYSMSSVINLNAPHFFIFDSEKTTFLSCDNNNTFMMPQITIDHNDYVWCYGFISAYGVWINKHWTKIDFSEFGEIRSIWAIKEAPDHKIWFGTEDGIYIKKE
jgi:ligand-binding sensor domain-containing protein